MKIDLQSIDRQQFMVHDHVVNGELMYLVQPVHIGCDWKKENTIFRSSLWTDDGTLVSAGFPKFVNWGEKPAVFPVPNTLDNCVFVEKLDGSLLIVSKYKGQYILRTRGTSDATKLDNGIELEIFKQTILPRLDDGEETWPYSILFEWTSPFQRIVINYGDEPQWFLVGIVNHDNYSLWKQKELDALANIWNLKRPETLSVKTLDDVKSWVGKEGVCVYSNNGQSIHKVKSDFYLIRHRFRSQASLENTLNLFFDYDCPSYQKFEKNLIELFDYECFTMVRSYASNICDASKQVNQIISGITNFVAPLKLLPRKDAAKHIISSYGNSGRAAMAFTLLDNKPLTTDQHKKLYWQVLKT